MTRLSTLRNAVSSYRQNKLKQAKNKSEVDTMILRAENEKLREEAKRVEAENKLRLENTTLKSRTKQAKKARFAAKLAPIKTAFDRAKNIAGNSPLANTAGATGPNNNPLTGGNNTFLKQFEQSAKPKSPVPMRKKKKRIKIIEYE